MSKHRRTSGFLNNLCTTLGASNLDSTLTLGYTQRCFALGTPVKSVGLPICKLSFLQCFPVPQRLGLTKIEVPLLLSLCSVFGVHTQHRNQIQSHCQTAEEAWICKKADDNTQMPPLRGTATVHHSHTCHT